MPNLRIVARNEPPPMGWRKEVEERVTQHLQNRRKDDYTVSTHEDIGVLLCTFLIVLCLIAVLQWGVC